MLLADLQEALTPPAKPCRAAVVLSALSEEEGALAAQIKPERLCRILRKNGLTLGEHTLAAHREGRCTCPSPTT